MNEEKLEFLIQNKYSEELTRHGIIHTTGFKGRVIYFNEKLTELAKKMWNYSNTIFSSTRFRL